MIELYWDIGRLIVERQQREGWGKGIIDQLARDIQSAFPEVSVFSPRNQRFILELGKGFAFVGRQYPLEVGGETFYLDLLFYHLHLRCFVVIDLKVQPFQPEFVGKLNSYSTAIDNLLRHATDHRTIGLLLCKERNRVIVEYALQDSARPLGVAKYRLLPEEIKANLPSPEEFEAQLATFDNAASPAKPMARTKPKTKPKPKTAH